MNISEQMFTKKILSEQMTLESFVNHLSLASESFVARSRGQKVTFCSLSSQRATVPVLLPPWNRRRLGASFACSPAVKACGHVPLAFAELLPQRGEAARDQARLGSEGRGDKMRTKRN